MKENVLDEKLIFKVAKSDINALETIYKYASTPVYSLALSITGRKEDAEDVLRDTFIKVYEKASTYKSPGNPLGWICTIARNLALMKLRERKRVVDFDYSNNINYSYVFGDDKLILDSAFSCLKSEELEIIMLHATSGMKHQEIADILDMPLSTVLSKYHRSLKKMLNFIEGRKDEKFN